MNWKYLASLIAVVAGVSLLALFALESSPNQGVNGRVVAHAPVDGVVVPGTDGKVKAYSNGVFSMEPANFGVTQNLMAIPDPDPETVAKMLAIPDRRVTSKQNRLRQVDAERQAKGFAPMTETEKQAFDINEQNAKLLKKTHPGAGVGEGDFVDPLVAKGQTNLMAPQAMPTPSLTFNGATAADNAAVGVGGLTPPDTNGDVGPNHYVSSVNLALKIFDKNGNVIGSPKKTSDLWSGLPANDPCRTRNDGDPHVIYDQLADRWHISQFSIPAYKGSGANYQCIAISVTGDPTGAYYVWSYPYPGNILNDYPKVGVWTDAYHMTFNQFNNAGTAFLGAGFFSQDRAKALVGDPSAGAIYRNIAPTDPNAGGILPPDIEGFVPPPAGMAAVLMEFRADEFTDPTDAIRSYRWVPDFVNPGNSTFSVLTDTTIAAFDPRQPEDRTDIEQQGGTALDSLSDRVMHRLSYRNLGTYENPVNSIVGNFVVNVSGVNPTSAATYQTGIRWFELRRTGDSFTVFDQGTHVSGAVDGATGLNNWMGSIATDNQGNIALGFSQSGSGQNADIKIAGRTGAPSGTLNEGEAMFFDAAGSQTGSSRWGDYSSMNVDPTDDCTFWYTQEYYATTSSTGWATRVGKFKYPSCNAAPKGTISGTITSCSSGLPVSNANVAATGGFQRLSLGNGTYTMTVTPGDYTVTADKYPGFVGSGVPVSVPSGGNATANICLSGVAVLNTGSSSILAESCGLPNSMLDPGETVTVSLPVTNIGGAPTVNLTATLRATGGVLSPSPAQNYGALAAAGGTNTKDFTFRVSGAVTCGADVTLTWDLQDGATSFGTITKTFSTGTAVVNISENFDGVTVPALPAGWTQVQTSGTGINWTTSTTTPNSSPNAAFANEPGAVNASALVSPPVAISVANAQLTFKNNFNVEDGFDGMVLEIKIGGGNFIDILTAGGSFVSGGYTRTISTSWQSPIGGRQAWSGNSAGYIDTVVNLPATAQGQNVQLRWVMATDSSASGSGVRIDDVRITGGVTCNGPCAPPKSVRADYDGDGKTDLSIWRPGDGNFWVYRSTDGPAALQWGTNGDTPLGADMNGDKETDIIINRPTSTEQYADFWILSTLNYAYSTYAWGVPGDIPVMADFNGDGKDDMAIWRWSETKFYILIPDDPNPVRVFSFGLPDDKPFAGNFLGDDRAEIAVYRPVTGTWYIAQAQGNPSAEFVQIPFGLTTDKPVAADYDGDGKDDIAVYRPGDGTWWIFRSSDFGYNAYQWGTSTDLPVPGDYDGDRKADVAIYRSGGWWVLKSSGGHFADGFGLPEDKPTVRGYLP